jgi:fructokinase
MSKRILGIGNAIVDIFVKVDDDFLTKNKLIKGSMKLIEKEEFESLKSAIKIEKIEAGGSVANTMAGIAYLKGKASFIGKINSDEFGKIYKGSLEKIKVNFPYSEKSENLSTGASIILITPDSERTMCTYLGISSQLSKDDIKEDYIKGHEIIFLEGYLWDKGISEEMFKHVINLAKKNNIKVAMSLSDIFCVKRHRKDFFNLLINDINILIGNENEINELMQKKNLLDCINELKKINTDLEFVKNQKDDLDRIKEDYARAKKELEFAENDPFGIAGVEYQRALFKEYQNRD